MKQVKLKHIIYQRIKNSIERGQFRFGEKISESTLADKYKTSKTPVKEALQALSREGVVVIKQRSGTYIETFDKKKVIDIFEHRRIIESAALKLAFQRNKNILFQELSMILDDMLNALESNLQTLYYDLDCEFHNVIVSRSDNEYLKKSYSLTVTHMKMLFYNYGAKVDAPKTSINDHQRIVSYIEDNNIDMAVCEIEKHLSTDVNAYLNMEL